MWRKWWMNKVLSIIIPSYIETAEKMCPLLSSILCQGGINFSEIEAIIVRDGTAQIDLQVFDFLPFDCKQVVLKDNVGTGMARQAGIDVATGQYVMCCDADDILYSHTVLAQMLSTMIRENPDILKTKWLEEVKQNNSMIYMEMCDDTSWMHGKMIRRSFLVEHNIRFHPELRWNEETYFLQLCDSWCNKIWVLPILSYVWKWGDDSITRRNNGIYTYECMPSFIKASSLAFQKISSFHPDHLLRKVTQCTLYIYFTLHEAGWHLEEHKEHLKLAEDAFKEWFLPVWKYFEIADPRLVSELYIKEQNRCNNQSIICETLDQWIDRLGMPVRRKEI